MKLLIKHLFLFGVGGFIYYGIEILWRGHSHWTMFLLSGGIFLGIGLINKLLSWDTPLWKQCTIASVIVTIAELITGLIINVWLGWDVWDYSLLKYNILGQVCLYFTIAWFFLSIVAIILDDYLRYWLFHEEKPRYKLF